MTKYEAAVVMAYTGYAMLKGKDLNVFYEYVAKLVGRPVYTHELADPTTAYYIHDLAANDFRKICSEIKEDK